jgi:hypothetical protein
MRIAMGLKSRVSVMLCLLACASSCALGQDEGDLTAKQKLFAGVGPGLRALKQTPEGDYYILAAPGAAVLVFNAAGKEIKKVPAYEGSAGPQSAALRSIQYGEDMDVDAAGTVYVADRGADAVKLWDKDGSAHLIAVNSPVSVAALGDGEVAVATLRDPHLVIVYGKTGREVREFGDPQSISDRPDLNRFLNIGELATDALGHLYYAFEFMPEPTVRQYDRHGYAGLEFQYTQLDVMPEAQAMRREIERQENKGGQPIFKRMLTAVGVDRANGEVWMAMRNTLMHFDKDGDLRGTYQISTPEGARLEATVILVQKDRLLIGNDPLGIFEFARPDKNVQP